MQAVLGSLSSSVIGRPDIANLMKQEPANTLLDAPYLLQLGQKVTVDGPYDMEGLEVEMELNNLLLSLRPIKQVGELVSCLFCKYLRISEHPGQTFQQPKLCIRVYSRLIMSCCFYQPDFQQFLPVFF